MKKTLLIMLIIVFVAGFAGCGHKYRGEWESVTIPTFPGVTHAETEPATKTETAVPTQPQTETEKATETEVRLSSDINDYVRMKEKKYSKINEEVLVPELIFESDITDSINGEISEFSNRAVDSDFVNSQYYVCELNDNYLVLYVVQRGINSTRSYLMYNIDVATGELLDSNDVVSLVSDSSDDFYYSLKDELIKQEKYIYTRCSSELEEKNENQVKESSSNAMPPEDDIERLISDEGMNNLKLAYLGGNRVLGIDMFDHMAGAEGSMHAFEFEYN